MDGLWPAEAAAIVGFLTLSAPGIRPGRPRCRRRRSSLLGAQQAGAPVCHPSAGGRARRPALGCRTRQSGPVDLERCGERQLPACRFSLAAGRAVRTPSQGRNREPARDSNEEVLRRHTPNITRGVDFFRKFPARDSRIRQQHWRKSRTSSQSGQGCQSRCTKEFVFGRFDTFGQ